MPRLLFTDYLKLYSQTGGNYGTFGVPWHVLKMYDITAAQEVVKTCLSHTHTCIHTLNVNNESSVLLLI